MSADDTAPINGEAIFITGLGVTAPTGLGVEAHWEATLAGRSAIGPLTRFDSEPYWATLAGEIQGYQAEEQLPGKLIPQTDHMTRLSLTAADWSLLDAGFSPDDGVQETAAVVTAATSGGYDFGQHEMQKLWADGPDHVSAYQSFAWFYAVNTGQISIRHKLHGPGAVVVSDQAGGLDAIAHARRQLRSGAPLALTGGVDSSLCPWAWVAHQAAGGLSPSTDPERAYLPFDRAASGFVIGEGGAIIAMENAEAFAERAGEEAYARLAGYAATFDSGRPGSVPALQRAITGALADAELTPDDVDVVFADASGVPSADAAEAAALNAVFGPNGVPVTAPKTMTGRLYAGGSSLDVATAALSVRHGAIPPTVHVNDVPAESGIDLVVDEPRDGEVRAALVLARGRGGFASAVVLAAA
jgi:act minimal PKS chain-length factor (CLF/KS beta)